MYIAMYRNFFAINCFLKVVKNIVMINLLYLHTKLISPFKMCQIKIKEIMFNQACV